MAIFAFAVSGKYPCVLWIRIYPSFQIENEAIVGQIKKQQMTVGLIFTLFSFTE